MLARYRTSRSATAALVVLVVLVLVAVFGPWLAPHDPNLIDLANALSGPSGEHPLGTDMYGRDVSSRLIAGTRVSLLASFECVLIALVIGVPTGLIAGFVGRWIDAVLSRIVDALYGLPGLILAAAIVGALGPGIQNAMIAIGIILSPQFFRLARGAAQSIREETYVEALRALGCRTPRLLVRHVLPNASGPLLVQAAILGGVAVSAEASLSFLGLGVQPPTSSWGSMVRDALENLRHDWYPLVPPSLMILVTIMAYTFVGEGVRAAWRGGPAGNDRQKAPDGRAGAAAPASTGGAEP